MYIIETNSETAIAGTPKPWLICTERSLSTYLEVYSPVLVHSIHPHHQHSKLRLGTWDMTNHTVAK